MQRKIITKNDVGFALASGGSPCLCHISHDLSKMFGRKKNAFATYSKSKPLQIPTKDHFPTPETPDDLWIPSSKDKPNSKQAAFPPVKAKGK